MKVKLTKSAVYEFNEDNFTAIPSTTFNKMVSSVKGKKEDTEDEMIFFSCIEEYVEGDKTYSFDKEKPVYVNEKGQIFVIVKNTHTNGTTDTEKNSKESTQSE